MPFHLKMKVMDACLLSSLLYGCESWFSNSLGKLQTRYMSAVKCILGVRQTTQNDVCLLECGQPGLRALVHHRQYLYFTKILQERANMRDDPLMFVIDLVRSHNTKSWQYIENILLHGSNVLARDIEARKIRLQTAESTKSKTYMTINPNLTVHPVYQNMSPFDYTHVPEHQRIAFTKFRTSSHKLRVETGRWSRIPHDVRLCDCEVQAVQDEQHAIEQCTHINNLREQFPDTNFTLNNIMLDENVCKFVYYAMEQYN